MRRAGDPIVDRSSGDSAMSLASWYAPGLSDGLGDRLLMFDNTSAPSLELLRFRPELTAAPGFEGALRERVEQLRRFRHPSFAQVRAVEWLGAGEGLALVSNYTPGKRLSQVLGEASGPGFALELVRQLTPALEHFHQQGDGIVHGALAAERIIVTPDGRLVIVEHVLGSALERLGLSKSRLLVDLGIRVPSQGDHLVPSLNRQTDIVQLALIAVSLAAGRLVGPDECAPEIERLLDATARRPAGASLEPQLRGWLERALESNDTAFATAHDARGDLSGPSRDGESRNEAVHVSLPPGPAPVEEVAKASAPAAAEPTAPPPVRAESPRPTGILQPPPPALHVVNHGHSASLTGPGADRVWQARAPRVPSPAAGHASPTRRSHDPERAAPAPTHVEAGRRFTPARALTAAVTVLAVGEAFVIAALLQAPAAPAAILIEAGQTGSAVMVDGQPAGVTPLRLEVGADTKLITVGSPATAASRPARTPPAVSAVRRASAGLEPPEPAAAAAGPVEPGGVRIVSPVEVQVFAGDRLLGTSADASIAAIPGRHTFDLVNSAVGYRSRQVVDVEAGRIVELGVSLPNGLLNINASPWAEVWIDGKLVGETPLGNLSVAPGEREIVFRHPELGERRQTALVKADAVTRVTENLHR